jgi:uncharacterized membrane protein
MTLEPILAAPLPIKLHLVSAVASMIVAATIFLNRKGTAFHRTLGWAFVVFLSATAISAIFIRRTEGVPNIAGFTPIHIFVVLTAIGLPAALVRIRRGDVKGHARAMRNLVFGALVIAGALAFLPGRVLNAALFGG